MNHGIYKSPSGKIVDLPAGEVVSFLTAFSVPFTVLLYYTLPLILIQVCASSIEKAQQVARVHSLLSTPGVFVGRQTYLALSSEDQALLCQCTSEKWSEDVIVSHVRSIFMPTHGHSGLLYRVGEFAIVNLNNSDAQSVIRITDIFAARSNNVCFNCIKGEMYDYILDESGKMEVHPYSYSAKMVPSANHLIVLSGDMLRKVMMVTTL